MSNNLTSIFDSTALIGLVFHRLSSIMFNNNPNLVFIAPYSAFTYSPQLATLDLTGCGFQYPPAISIQKNNSLEILEMSGNPFLSLKGAGDTHMNSKSLVELDMSDSYKLTGGKPGTHYLEADTFIDIPMVRSLRIRGNGHANMDAHIFDGVPLVKTLDISYNQYRTPKTSWFTPFVNLTALNAGHNPWKCDCHSLDFKNYLMTLPQDASNALYHSFQCNQTGTLTYFEDVDSSKFVCGGTPGTSYTVAVSILLTLLSILSF